MGQMTNPKPFIFHRLNISRDDGMDENGIDWLYGCCLIGFWLKVGQITSADFCYTPTTNLTQYDSHGPDDQPKTIHHHHLDMSRDDGMDEHGIDWLYGCGLVGFWLKSWANHIS
jgi:hypothetical protein